MWCRVMVIGPVWIAFIQNCSSTILPPHTVPDESSSGESKTEDEDKKSPKEKEGKSKDKDIDDTQGISVLLVSKSLCLLN